jgi:nucleoside-diphosphate-sugar epimerase
MTVLVFGGSSQIGRFLLPRLLARGERVLALSRHERASQPGVQWIAGSLPDSMPVIEPVSAIISFGPLGGFAQWLERADLSMQPKVIATSSMSAETKRDSDVPAERSISQQLHAAEHALADVCTRHGCPWTVLRPTLIYGAGLDKSLTPIAHRAMRMRLFPLPAGRGLRQPVHAEDIAQAVVAILDQPEAAGRVLSIGGGERLPAGDMFARVRASLPVATVPLPLPAWLLRLGRHAVPRFRGPLTRLEADLVADNSELQRLLGVTPRPFRPDAGCWVKQGT